MGCDVHLCRVMGTLAQVTMAVQAKQIKFSSRLMIERENMR